MQFRRQKALLELKNFVLRIWFHDNIYISVSLTVVANLPKIDFRFRKHLFPWCYFCAGPTTLRAHFRGLGPRIYLVVFQNASAGGRVSRGGGGEPRWRHARGEKEWNDGRGEYSDSALPSCISLARLASRPFFLFLVISGFFETCGTEPFWTQYWRERLVVRETRGSNICCRDDHGYIIYYYYYYYYYYYFIIILTF
jgi:hypothetical protein